ncbi:MAG: prolyl oligopeptidase family serine peptidase [Bacteroidia bacterium]|nr:prolyl oligopeptidase family serine peptidase [Bacteroidia bacterium]
MKNLLFATVFCFTFLLSFAQENKWTVNDIIQQESLSDAVFSPDGNMVAWTKRRPSAKKDRFVTDLYLTRLTGEAYKEVQLTRTEDSDRNPVFSADGETLYFLSSRGTSKSLWALSIFGGDAYVVDSFPNGISQLARLNDSMLVFVSNEGKTRYEQELKKNKDDVVVVEDSVHQQADRLFAYSPKTKKTRRLTNNAFPLSEYAVSRDGNWIVTTEQLSPHYPTDGKPKPEYRLWNLQGNGSEYILRDLLDPGNFLFTAGSKGFYFTASKTSDPEWQGAGISLLYYYDLGTRSSQQVDLNWANGLAGGRFISGENIIVTLADGAYNQLALYQKQSKGWQQLQIAAGAMDRHISIEAVSENGQTLLFSHSTASQLPAFYLANLLTEGKKSSVSTPKTFTTLNKALLKKTTAKSEVVSWTGALQETVNGILIYPMNYEEGRKYPLVVAIHGGPSGVDTDRWSDRWAYPHQLLAQEGVFILKPNYHGSSNHGLAFVESIKKHYYEYELPDIVAGIDYLAGRGLITKDSLATMGWSNGAILTTMLTVQYPTMFKVAAAGAGDVNWSSDFGTCEFGVTFDQSYFGGAPWDNVDGLTYNPAYILKSPLFEMEKVLTPTLIHHGSDDRAVPRDQGWEYYRALQQNGKAPVRFLWYPDQPHGLGKLSHQRRKVQEEMDWIKQYLFGKTPENEEVFDEESPLAAMLALQKAKHVNGLYGVMVNGALIPETSAIAKDSIEIGIFEVTNAQFASFRPNEHRFRADALNHPATGISFEDAKAYVRWLSEKTGDNYRLPTESEGNSWRKSAMKAAKDENTIRYWAGYDLTLDEYPRFLEKVTLKDPLTMAAGSFPATAIGEAKVYDLGGNVSEWYGDAAIGKQLGYGFLDFVDNMNEQSSRKNACTGLRVVKE